MAELSVSEASRRLGVNVQRVHQRIADGSLPARRVGHQYVIDEADLARVDRRPAGRPLSERSAWDVLRVAAGHESRLGASARSRARSRLDTVLDADDVPRELRHLLRERGRRLAYDCAARDLPDLAADRRVHLAGVSAVDAGMDPGGVVEAYLSEEHLDALVEEYLLVASDHDRANVVLHVVAPARAPDLIWAAPLWLVVAADLAEHHRPREGARASELVREANLRFASEPRERA